MCYLKLPYFLHVKTAGQDLLIVEASTLQQVIYITHDRVRPVAEISNGQTSHSQQTDKNASGGIRNALPAREPPETHAQHRVTIGISRH